ncbi:hypothetical protein ANO11243_096270 [Dothideomycetidae sp. 11243]|nr:hypothetical protein ANO11243_096270 [fungal sp. No.11243]
MAIRGRWQGIAAAKQQHRASLIPAEWRLPRKPDPSTLNVLDVPARCGLLTQRELHITSDYDALALAEELKAGTFSAEETTRAFCKRAAIAQQLVNCLTEIFFDEAIERAKSLDKERASRPREQLRPLHGLPISLKDSFRVPGVDSTIGLACFAIQPDDRTSPLPQLLLDLGAVLYCKTNVPQTLMTADSDNNVFGRTLNPNNLNLTAGGSTGGEGALIALRGSILGIGTDVAGSIRIPSVCNGICGFKPSVGLVPYGDQREPVVDGVAGIEPSSGPLATTVRSCEYLIKTVVEAKSWLYDPLSNHVRWQGVTPDIESLRIGVVYDDGMYTPHPPVARTMRESVQALEAAGVVVIPIRLPDVVHAVRAANRLFCVDENKFIQELIHSTGEPFVPSVVKKDLPGSEPMNLDKLFQLTAERYGLQYRYHQLFIENRLDAIMTPPAPHTAVQLDEWLSISYTCIWNLMDYPACVIPTGHVKSSDVKRDVSEAQYGDLDRPCYELYTGPTEFIGAPTAVQLVGLRQEDERLLQIAKVVQRILQERGYGPIRRQAVSRAN